jgi:hypothetical protein
MAHDIFKQLIEINTTDSVGSTTLAAQAIDSYYAGVEFHYLVPQGIDHRPSIARWTLGTGMQLLKRSLTL